MRKRDFAWIVKAPAGYFLDKTLSSLYRSFAVEQCLKHYHWGETWAEYKKQGFRVVKVYLSEKPNV